MSTSAVDLLNIIMTAVQTIIAVAGLLYGGYSLWDGFTADQPQEKKRGIIVLIVTVVIFGVLLAAKPVIVGMIT